MASSEGVCWGVGETQPKELDWGLRNKMKPRKVKQREMKAIVATGLLNHKKSPLREVMENLLAWAISNSAEQQGKTDYGEQSCAGREQTWWLNSSFWSLASTFCEIVLQLRNKTSRTPKECSQRHRLPQRELEREETQSKALFIFLAFF